MFSLTAVQRGGGHMEPFLLSFSSYLSSHQPIGPSISPLSPCVIVCCSSTSITQAQKIVWLPTPVLPTGDEHMAFCQDDSWRKPSQTASDSGRQSHGSPFDTLSWITLRFSIVCHPARLCSEAAAEDTQHRLSAVMLHAALLNRAGVRMLLPQDEQETCGSEWLEL